MNGSIDSYQPFDTRFSKAELHRLQRHLQIQHPAVPTTSLPDVRLTPFEQALPDKRLAQQEFDILLRPVFGRQRLQKHHDLLEIHALQLFGPFDEESSADVEVKV